jgi:hypothetical protein
MEHLIFDIAWGSSIERSYNFSFLFRGRGGPGCEADPSPPSNSEAKNVWSYTASSPSSFLAWHSGSLTFTFVLPLMFLHLSLFGCLCDTLLIQYGTYSFRAGPSGYVLCFRGNLCFTFRQHSRYGRWLRNISRCFLISPGQVNFMHTVYDCGLVKSHFCQLRRPAVACFWSYHLKS